MVLLAYRCSCNRLCKVFSIVSLSTKNNLL